MCDKQPVSASLTLPSPLLQDFGQALDTSHPEHQEYLLRDLNIVNAFFLKKGVAIQDAQRVLDGIVAGGASRAPAERGARRGDAGVSRTSEGGNFPEHHLTDDDSDDKI